MIPDSYISSVYLSKLFPFPDFVISLWQAVLYQFAQLGVQNMSSDNILEQVELAIRLYFEIRPQSRL